jgi:hypothetical protein
MRSPNKHRATCAVLLSFILVIFTAGATAENNSTIKFNADTYQLPMLQFNDLQQKIVVSKALSPTEENTAIHAFNAETLPADDIIQEIPEGSIIHHSVDGITTVFDKNGIQLISAEDASAGLISIPGGYKPATMVHELPSGSVLYPSDNTTYVVFNDKIILVEITDTPLDAATVSRPAPLGSNPAARFRAEPVSASSAMDFDPDKVFLERVGLEYYPYMYDDDIKVSSVQWKVPAAPKTVRPSQIQYLEFLRVADDEVDYYDSSAPGGIKSINSFLNFAAVSEWNRNSNTWDMSTWIQNTNVSRPTYYSPGIHVNTGDNLTGEIISRYDLNTTAAWNNTEYWSTSISDPRGQISNLSLVARNMESVLNSGNPVEYRFEVSGDYSADSEDNFIGDTTFSDFIFTSQKNLPLIAGNLPVWCVYVNSWFDGKPQFKDMRIENKWPVSLLLGTQAPAPQGYTFSMTNTAYRTDANATKGELMDNAVDNCNNLNNELKKHGWKEPVIDKQGSAVTKADFNINPEAGHTTLNSAVLHYHTGHGSSKGTNNRTNLALLDQNNDAYSFDASEVTGKWGGNNKWVILDSCYLMLDEEWGNALDTSHGVMGFKTQVKTPPSFTTRFVEYAIDGNQTVYTAYRKATYDLLKDSRVPKNPGDTEDTEKTVAAVIFKDYNQAKYDYLPGVKTGVYTGILSGERFVYDWPCDEPPKGVN